jgi:hypothetical protein
MIKTGGHFAGAMLGDNGEHIKLSRREQKIIMNIRKDRQPYPTEGDDESRAKAVSHAGRKEGAMSTQLAIQAANARVMKNQAMTETEIIATIDTIHMKRPKSASYVTWTIIGRMNAETLLPRKTQSLKRRIDTAVTRIKAVIITKPTLAASRGQSCLE